MFRKTLMVLLGLVLLASTSSAATFTVTTTADAPPGVAGELRWAMNMANATPGQDTITFNIPGTAPFVILPVTQLPMLTDHSGVVIDGRTQPGTTCGASPPLTLNLTIEINGSMAGNANGIYIVSNNNQIIGLVVRNFYYNGIYIEGQTDANFNYVHCCIIGLDYTGLVDQGNGTVGTGFYAGIKIANQASGFAMDNDIVGNVISGNWVEGVWVQGPIQPGDVGRNHIVMNFIGTDINGTSAIPNDHEGVELSEGTHHNDVLDNLISGNIWDGVGIQGYGPDGIYTDSNVIAGNTIGLDFSKTNPIPNGYHGVAIGEYGPPRATPNQWGFARWNHVGANFIANNGGDGVSVWEDNLNTVNADYNMITNNNIYNNVELGIDLQNDGVTLNDPGDPDNQANNQLNFPTIDSAIIDAALINTTIYGKYDVSQHIQVEVFKAIPDPPTSYGEGAQFLGYGVLDGVGNWTYTTTSLALGDYVTATGIDGLDNTSEFCLVIQVSTGGSAPWDCSSDPPPGKTGGGFETENNDACAVADLAACENAYCGDITPDTDEDWWVVTLPADTCYCLHVRVLADATTGTYATGGGLDPDLTIYAGDCSTQLYYNDDYNGTFPDAEVTDAQYDCTDVTNCHQPGTTLYIKITGQKGSEGPYLLVINCDTCTCPEEPDTCTYYKPGYLDYCPNGMPDFDQRQDQWFILNPAQQWTHCGPVALANCFWWFDSKFEPTPVDPRPFYPGPGSPGLNDNFPLVPSFDPTGGWDDHDTSNVRPLVDSLALYCKTNNWGKSGTNVDSLAVGAQRWLTKVGLASYFTVNVFALAMDDPNHPPIAWEELEGEVLRSQDVIVLVGFYAEVEPFTCERIGGHFMTVAGVCEELEDSALCVSDPYWDVNEGEPPLGASGHNDSTHNDALLVSGPHGTIHHDRYDVTANSCTPVSPPRFLLELPTYPASGAVVNFQGLNEFDGVGSVPPGPQPIHTVLEYAVIICPTDADGDGEPDLTDNCVNVPNPDQANDDADSLGNACDNCPNDDNDDQADGDSDTVGDVCDNCPTVSNTDQANDDADSLGNACDNCPNDDNNDQADGDSDTVGDVCDNCPTVANTTQTNDDTDSLGNACDNCPNDDNDDQANNDSDSMGDVCDPDDDNDGILDDGDGSGTIGDNPCTGGATTNCDDNCQFTANADQADADSDGIGDVCDTGECCVGKTGDVNCSSHPLDSEPDISDIVRLIDYLYLTKDPLCCHGEAETNGSCDPEPDISDIVRIIDYLYLATHTPVAQCSDCP